jgi:hypothetical protein
MTFAKKAERTYLEDYSGDCPGTARQGRCSRFLAERLKSLLRFHDLLIFELLDAEEPKALACQVSVRKVAQGQIIFQAGDP